MPTSRRLGAVLLNPPTGEGQQTRRQLALAAEILDCSTVEIANLFHWPTKSMRELLPLATQADGWLEARADLLELMREAEELLFAWGVAPLKGAAESHRRAQIDWVLALVEESGRELVWSVGGVARHPSRWHQYLSDKYGRTSGGDSRSRLGELLQASPAVTFTVRSRTQSVALEAENLQLSASTGDSPGPQTTARTTR